MPTWRYGDAEVYRRVCKSVGISHGGGGKFWRRKSESLEEVKSSRGSGKL
jgi:hypothetical protein